MKLSTETCVIESRLHLSRNISEYPFPILMTADLSRSLIAELKQAFQSEKIVEIYHLSWRSGKDVGYAEQKMLQLKYGFNHKRFEDHSYQMVEDPSKNLMIFVGTDDHIRIQMNGEGLMLNEIWSEVNHLDDQLDSLVEYAFDSELGYLTSHVTSVGTGIHASILMHLPALTEIGYIERMNQAASQLGLIIVGLYDQTDKGLGGLYRIENNVTLGRSEIEIIDTINEVARQIAVKENDALETLLLSKRLEIEDLIHRSIGILSSARLLERNELLQHLSNVRMGIRANMLTELSMSELDKLIFSTDSGVLQLESGKIMNAQELKAYRADLCRAFFEKEA